MISYLELKQKIKLHKQEAAFGCGAVAIFLLGFGTGRGVGAPQTPIKQINYSIKKQGNVPGDKPAAAAPGKTVPAPDLKNCPVKGNISAKGNKTYHVKGGAFFNRTNPEQCFNTEAEAKAAGFKKSSR